FRRVIDEVKQGHFSLGRAELPIPGANSPIVLATAVPVECFVMYFWFAAQQGQQALAIKRVFRRRFHTEGIERRGKHVQRDNRGVDLAISREPCGPTQDERRTNTPFIEAALESLERRVVRAHGLGT